MLVAGRSSLVEPALASHKSQATAHGLRFASHESRVTSHGFTLVELIVVLAIVTLVLGFSIPWFSQLSSGHRLKAATREVAGALQTARSYAIGLGQRHAVVFELSEEPSSQTAGRYSIEDASGQMVGRPMTLPAGVSFAAPEGQGEAVTFEDLRVSFTSVGAGSESGTVWLSGGRERYSRISVSEATGQIRVEALP